MICPADGGYCCDDLCFMGDCLRMPGVRSLERCSWCGQVYSDDIECACEPDEEEPEVYDDRD